MFTGQRGPLTRNGVWRVVKGLMAAVGLDPRYATHSCRHTYATHLYRASGHDLEVVQEQLGHASIKTTTIYARVTKEDKLQAANALAKVFASTGGRKERSRTRVSPPTAPLALCAMHPTVPIPCGIRRERLAQSPPPRLAMVGSGSSR